MPGAPPMPPPAGARPNAALHRLTSLSVATAIAGLTFLAIDACCRSASRFSFWDHSWGALLLYGSLSGLAVLILWLWSFLETGIAFIVPGRSAKHVAFSLRALLIVACTWPVSQSTFSGSRVSQTILADVGPPLMGLLLGTMTYVLSFGLHKAITHKNKGRPKAARRMSTALIVVAGLIFWADLSVYPFLYPDLHTLLEACAGILVGVAWWLFPRASFSSLPRRTLHGIRRLTGPRWLARRLTALHRLAHRLTGLPGLARRLTGPHWLASGLMTLTLLGLAVCFAGARKMRTYVDSLLAHTWLEEVYVGRMVRRVQELEANAQGYANLDMARRKQLLQRFDIHETSLDPAWLTVTPARPAPPELTSIKNIAVFYVDTLREDVTRDPELMPHLARFRAGALDFTNAYAIGSDTLRSLPGLTGGNQFVQHSHPGDLLHLAQESEHESVLISASSAHTFLDRLRPQFAFEKTIRVPDFDADEKVWGYGGHRPTATRIVDRAASYLRHRSSDSPFFLWLFHFDQHAWRELDEDHIDSQMARHDIQKKEKPHFRYRTVAASLDAQFGRFLEILETTGHADSTAVLFVSDHGEALGQEGYWVHSIFLWDSLIHVPLALRVPGVPGRRIQTPVSLIDVAPTLAPILGGHEAIYHGQDLLQLAGADGEASFSRRFPLILRSASGNRLSRVGVIDSANRRKFVLRIQALFPELYALDGDPRDQRNLAPLHSAEVQRFLRLIARSPVFPRTKKDFSLLKSRGELSSLLSALKPQPIRTQRLALPRGITQPQKNRPPPARIIPPPHHSVAERRRNLPR